jgi:hypothetical protein
MPATKRATEETSKTANKPTAKVAVKASSKPASKAADVAELVTASTDPVSAASRPVASTRKPSKTALSPSEVTPLALLTPSKPARRRRSGAAKPRKLKGATTTWPFPTGSRP